VLDNCLVTRLGWTKTVITTNVATYKQPAGNGYYLYVDDTGTTTARIKGVEAASGTAINLQVNPFPNETLLAGGCYFWKSSTADATTRAYFFWGDTKTFYLVTYPSTFNILHSFGDFVSFQYPNTEAGTCYIIGQHVAAPTNTTAPGFQIGSTSLFATQSGHFIARPYTGLGNALYGVKYPEDLLRHRVGLYELGNWGLAYPFPSNGQMLMSKVLMCDAQIGPRGVMRGIMVPCHARPVGQGSMLTGAAGTSIAGKNFELIYGANDGCIFAELTDTFDNTL
jgi:hypothetical protein